MAMGLARPVNMILEFIRPPIVEHEKSCMAVCCRQWSKERNVDQSMLQTGVGSKTQQTAAIAALAKRPSDCNYRGKQVNSVAEQRSFSSLTDALTDPFSELRG